jgi:hypothetical protein
MVFMPPAPTYRPALEQLEARELPATGITAIIQSGQLVVQGTSSNDYISVSQVNGQLSVYGAQIRNGSSMSSSVSTTGITRVVINGGDGNDTIITTSVTIDETIIDGPGNNTIYGGSGNDLINGGTGRSTIVGGAGNDYLIGGANASVFGGGGYNWYNRPIDPNSLFINGASATDIHQGQAPLCSTDAALAEAAQQGHNFAGDIRYLGNNTYSVKLYGGLAPQVVYFGGWTNDQDPVCANGEFWPILMQRARLQALGIDPLAQHSQADWDAWNQRLGGRLYSVSDALYSFTGSYAPMSDIKSANALQLQSALAGGAFVLALSPNSGSISSDGIIRNHTYAVLRVYQDAGTWKVRLYNPWGTDEGNVTTLDKLDSAPAANDGIITLSWAQFTNSDNFQGYFVAAKK